MKLNDFEAKLCAMALSNVAIGTLHNESFGGELDAAAVKFFHMLRKRGVRVKDFEDNSSKTYAGQTAEQWYGQVSYYKEQARAMRVQAEEAARQISQLKADLASAQTSASSTPRATRTRRSRADAAFSKLSRAYAKAGMTPTDEEIREQLVYLRNREVDVLKYTSLQISKYLRGLKGFYSTFNK